MESAPDPGPEHVPTSSSLSPKVVGQRVVVRSRVPDETGPTGGPAFTDVLGVLERWADGVLTIRTAEDDLVEIPAALVVAGKPVPPRPSRFSRISADEVERRCAGFERFTEVVDLGDWQLRVADVANPLGSAALLVGEPGVGLEDALDALIRFYTERDRHPAARVVVDSPVEQALRDRGWSPMDVERADDEVQVAGIAALVRQLREIDTSEVVHESALDLEDATIASIWEDGSQLAHARATIVDGWALLADLDVQPEHRRLGLARRMMAGMAEWAAERGASVMAVQVNSGNAPAQALYADLGFERHHRYRYLTGRA